MLHLMKPHSHTPIHFSVEQIYDGIGRHFLVVPSIPLRLLSFPPRCSPALSLSLSRPSYIIFAATKRIDKCSLIQATDKTSRIINCSRMREFNHMSRVASQSSKCACVCEFPFCIICLHPLFGSPNFSISYFAMAPKIAMSIQKLPTIRIRKNKRSTFGWCMHQKTHFQCKRYTLLHYLSVPNYSSVVEKLERATYVTTKHRAAKKNKI